MPESSLSTEFLIGLQFVVLLALAVIMLLILLFRQKKTIARLQAILTAYKDDISGESLARYLAEEIDITTAHSSKNAVALNAELAAEEMGAALRFHALRTELSLLQAKAETETDLPWREQIKRYEPFSGKINDLMRNRIDQTTRSLNDVHAQELSARDQTLSELTQQRNDQAAQLKKLKPLQDFIQSATTLELSPPELEQLLHRTLLSLCENFTGSEKLRELTYLLHEAFNETVAATGTAGEPASRKPLGIDPGQNLEMLNNIINKQNETIRTLRKQVSALENDGERQGLLESVAAMEDSIGSSQQCMQKLDASLQGSDAMTPVTDMQRMIEQFTEESAVMVEKIYLLTNLNKKLNQENDELRAQSVTDGTGTEATTGLKLKIEQQKQEILQLQHSFKDLEEKYLSLYSSRQPS